MLITGGSRGLGLAAARQLAEKGANVVIVARNADKLKAALERISVCLLLNIKRVGKRSAATP